MYHHINLYSGENSSKTPGEPPVQNVLEKNRLCKNSNFLSQQLMLEKTPHRGKTPASRT